MDVGFIRLGIWGAAWRGACSRPSEGAVVIDRPEGTVAFAI